MQILVKDADTLRHVRHDCLQISVFAAGFGGVWQGGNQWFW
jgi:hypothetical protein